MPFSRKVRFRRTLIAAWKYWLSFGKRNWSLSDYPVQVVQQTSTEAVQTGPEWRRIPIYRAEIINWHQVIGAGDTEEEALQSLLRAFEERSEKDQPLPRPGSRAPIDIKVGPSDRVDRHGTTLSHFINDVLGYERAFVSDESTLWDFTTEPTLDSYFVTIQRIYGVDVSQIESGNIADILDLIADAKHNSESAEQNPVF